MLDKIPKKSVQEILNNFIVHVTNQSKRNLTLNSSNKTKQLHKSIKGEAEVHPNSFELEITMEDYWKFINYGVKGVESGRSLAGFRYKSRGGLKGMPPPSAFKTDKINRPVSMQQAFASAVNVFKKGIKPTEFFSRPFESAFNSLPDEIIEAYGLDIEDFLKYTIEEDGI